MTEEIKYWLASIHNAGGVKIQNMLSYAGSAEEVWKLKEEDFLQIQGIGSIMCEHIIYSRDTDKIRAGLANMKKKGIRLVCQEDAEYPKKLLDYHDRPFALFVAGELPADSLTVAIVGARNCSQYGKYMAETAGRLLAENGIQVISGMAQGIDACGHWGALLGGGKTYAILGTGVDICFPAANYELYEKLKQTGGICSEYPPGTPGMSYHFPARNRIISQFADIVLVVEAKEKSGSLITADMALEYGKDVYAVPGRTTDNLSIGCNRLIQQGAGIVLSPEKLLEDLQILSATEEKNCKKNELGLENKNHMLYSCLDFSPKTLEEISETFTGSRAELLEGLLDLEMSGLIAQKVPGTYYRIK